ncbi:TetR/AcrR family transcriptional regulator [Allonocardiopsis opalescens]|uniref:TetR family transcriptional regulator n=1 Tax=Allonocardiopsis opalescens TaxID=1144618 RepID=A0A2T0PYI7_9ACTN|nr:TetR/AcrR family transcriptional regulator [Allonocardiopsis opalescens]PRX96578.1 TetR family transcriptional regulator [Allonocardiopsis opalescens]
MRTVNPQLREERTRQIRSGAVAAFSRNGYANTTVAELRRATGLSSGALFHYFADKAAIFRAVVEAACAQQRERLAAIDTTEPLPAFWATIDVLSTDFTDPQAAGMSAAILERLGADPELATLLADHEALVVPLLTTLIERLQEQRLMDASIPPARAARWITSVVDGLILNCGDEDFDATAEAGFLTHALRRTFRIAE